MGAVSAPAPNVAAPPAYAGPNYPNPPAAPAMPSAPPTPAPPVPPVIPAAAVVPQPAPARLEYATGQVANVPPVSTPPVSAPVGAPVPPPVPAPQAPSAAPALTKCRICQADVPSQEYAAHVAQCASAAAAQAQAGFKQEV